MKTKCTILIAALLAGCGKPADVSNPTETTANTADAAAPVSPPAHASTAPATAAEDDRQPEVIKALIQTVGTLDDKARTAIAYADIGGDDREEALVYLVDPTRCGSGGCSLIVLTPSGKGWRTIAQTSVTQLPVHRLLTKKDGWNDLAVGIGGGGAPAGTALLRFENKRYPDNPSVQPILNRLPEGARLLISDDYDHLTPVP